MSESLLTCETALNGASGRIPSDSPRLDAELLLSHITGWSRTSFRAWPERTLSAHQAVEFERLVAIRVDGCPIAHLLGEQGFWSLSLDVSDATLIPRPDTECLVEAALALELKPQADVLDLGTGTGAIALALASERPQWRILACDSAPAAVELARANAARLGLAIAVRQSNWFADLQPARFDLIISNPPYIAEGDPHLTIGDVRFEPASALVAGNDGLDDLRHIVKQAPAWLNSGGWLLVEHGYDQAVTVQGFFRAAGFEEVSTGQDYGGQDRLTQGRLMTTHANMGERNRC